MQNYATTYYSDTSLNDQVLQLEVSVGFSSMHRPATNTIAIWGDQGVGPYPLSDTRGATDNTSIVIDQGTGMISQVENIKFIDQEAGVLGLHSQGGVLYNGAFNLQASASNVTSDVSGTNTPNGLIKWSSTDNHITNTTITDDGSIITLNNILKVDGEGGLCNTNFIYPYDNTTKYVNINDVLFHRGIVFNAYSQDPNLTDNNRKSLWVDNSLMPHLHYGNSDLERGNTEISYESSSSTNTFLVNTVSGNPVEVTPSTISSSSNQIFSSYQGRIIYIGPPGNNLFKVSYNMSLKLNSGTTYDSCLIQIRKNSLVVTNGGGLVNLTNNNLNWNMSNSSKNVTLTTNDYVSVFITNPGLHNIDLYNFVLNVL